jgi:hypothetical protein
MSRIFIEISIIGFYLLVFAQSASAVQPYEDCNIPQDLQRKITSQYPGTKLVRLMDMDERDRGFFTKEHGNRCPGLIKVDFYGDGKPTWAIVLIEKEGKKDKAKLVVAHQVLGNWSTTLLDIAKSSVPVVWKEGPGKYQDVYGKKTIRATRPVIVFCGYESWAILYAWTGKKVVKVWIAD